MLSAVIVAAGSSKRVGFDKLFSKIGDRSVLEHALAAFEEAESVSELSLSVGIRKLIQDAIKQAGFRKVHAVVRGGERRQDSVNRTEGVNGKFRVRSGARCCAPVDYAPRNRARVFGRAEIWRRSFGFADNGHTANLLTPIKSSAARSIGKMFSRCRRRIFFSERRY